MWPMAESLIYSGGKRFSGYFAENFHALAAKPR
jgi:hypothetical protein